MYSYKGVDVNFKYKVGTVEAKSDVEAVTKIKEEEGILLVTSIKKTKKKNKNSLSFFLQQKMVSIENSLKAAPKKPAKTKSKNPDNKKKNPNKKPSMFERSPIVQKFASLVANKSITSKSQGKTMSQELEEEIKRLFQENDATAHSDDILEQIDKVNVKKKVPQAKDGKALNWDLLEVNKETPEIKKNNKIKVKPKEILMFTNRLQIMLSSGVTLLNALITLQESSDKKMTIVLERVISDINQGNNLSSSLAKFPKIFDSTYISLVSIGETSGELDKCLLDIIKMKEQEQKILRKIRIASIYPVIVFIVLIALVSASSFFFLPKFEVMFDDASIPMPAFTTLIFGITSKVPFLVVLLAIGLVLLTIARKKVPRVNQLYRLVWDRMLLKTPLVKKISVALYFYYFSSTVSLMLKNGIRLSDTLLLASKSINNIYIKSEIEKIGELMLHGMTFSEAMRKQPHFDSVLINITKTGEDSGKMVDCLEKVSDFYNKELNTSVDQALEAIPSISIIAIGLIVAPIIIAAYLPILDISSGATAELS